MASLLVPGLLALFGAGVLVFGRESAGSRSTAPPAAIEPPAPFRATFAANAAVDQPTLYITMQGGGGPNVVQYTGLMRRIWTSPDRNTVVVEYDGNDARVQLARGQYMYARRGA